MSVGKGLVRPVVGRDRELAILRAALEDASCGTLRVVLVSGEAGIGKSRLAEQIAADAENSGAVVAWGRCYEGTGAPAFWPWVQILRQFLDHLEPDITASAFGPCASDLGQLVPEIDSIIPTPAKSSGDEAAVDPAVARFRLYDAVTRSMARLARARPLVLVLDDLHQADEPTLRLLVFSASHLGRAPVLLVGTYRSGQVEGPLAEALADLSRAPMVERVALRGLSSAAIGELIEAATGRQAEPKTVDVVHARTDGNPFFASELVRLVATEGGLDPERLGRAVPESVRDLISLRLARLPDETRQLLNVAAVAGHNFEVAVVSAATAVGNDAVQAQIELALSAGLVVEHPNQVGYFRFAHVLICDAIREAVGLTHRAKTHAKVAAAIEERYGRSDPTHVGELAYHYMEAAPVLGPDPAITACMLASDAAIAALAFEPAVDWLRRALDLIDRLPANEVVRKRELAPQLGVLLTKTLGFGSPAAADAWRRTHQLSSQIGVVSELLPALWGSLAFAIQGLNFSAADAILARLTAIAHDNGDLAFALALHLGSGVLAVHRVQLVAAQDHLERALPLADALDEPGIQDLFMTAPAVFCRSYLGIDRYLLGDTEGANTMFAEAMDLAGRDEMTSFTKALATAADGWHQLCERNRAGVARRAHEIIGLAEAAGLSQLAQVGRVLDGLARAIDRADDETLGAVTAALDTVSASGWVLWLPMCHAILAEANMARGDHIGAREEIDRAMAEITRTGDRTHEPEVRCLRAEILAHWPELAGEAHAELTAALDVATRQQAGVWLRRIQQSPAQPVPAGSHGADHPVGQAGRLPRSSSHGLSPRELELLALLAQGLTDQEIGHVLFISVRTVRSHLDRIRDKTGRRRRPDLTLLATELGLVGRSAP